MLHQYTMSMSRFSKIFVLLFAALTVVSCGERARISGTLKDAPSSEIVVKLLDINKYVVLDTIKTDASAYFSYKVDVAKGNPEFVYLFRNDRKIASLLLRAGDNVIIAADTLGGYAVIGSDECLKLAQVEADFAAAVRQMEGLVAELEAVKEGSKESEQIRKEMGKAYVDYYRSRVKYVMENSHSLTVVPVFYQYFSANLPVFSQNTDALHFTSVSDSLATVYPDSKYVKALREEAVRRTQFMDMYAKISHAEEVGFPDVELTDLKGEKKKLSDVNAKVVMLHFWNPEDAQQKMFNLDVLASVYKDYHKKGFEIYQVGLDVDKAQWAKVVKEQNLPWINVCDSRGGASPYVTTYNLTSLPVSYFIGDGALVGSDNVTDEKSLRALLDSLL